MAQRVMKFRNCCKIFDEKLLNQPVSITFCQILLKALLYNVKIFSYMLHHVFAPDVKRLCGFCLAKETFPVDTKV